MPELPPIPRRWRIPIFLGLFLASALVTLLILLSSRPAGPMQAAPPVRALPAGAQDVDLSVSLPDFLIPEEAEEGGGQGIVPFRERFTSWSEEQVGRFWIPLREIARDVLAKKNDEGVDALLRDVP